MSDDESTGTESSTPALAHAASPFLRHGAEQPVHWRPWGTDAFDQARREDRPVLLDIGGVWCHWCHVMDHESYEDEETAALINELFVPVKVDRDERPDVDARYQRAVQAMTGQGGWPLTAFLTPAGEPFYGGTYFPPEDRHGRPAFRRVLNEVARVWREEPDQAREMARTVRERLSAYEQAEAEPGEVGAELVDRAISGFVDTFDVRHGGFGAAPKFPNAGALQLLLDRYLDDGDELHLRIVRETLAAMGRGGVYDQLGGGFHRYSTDARWLVPHFEKMAYDNGVLLEIYARAHAVAPDPVHADVIDGVLRQYRELSPELLARGGFPASQDADVGPGDDGAYWTWTVDEIRAALGDDERLVEIARLRYGLDDPDSAMHSDASRHVLYRAMDAPEIAARLELDAGEAYELLAEVAARLADVRAERPRPFVDESVYAGWNALVASGCFAAARYAGRDDAAALGLRALDRIWDEAFDPDEGVAHRVGGGRGTGYLEDQAFVAQALLDAYELTQRTAYLERAGALADLMLDRYRHPDSGAFSDRPRDASAAVEALNEPIRPITDSPTPAANAVAALVMLRLHALVRNARHAEAAAGVLRAFAGSAEQLATAMATYARAVDWATRPVATVVIVGRRDDGAANALFRVALEVPRPRTVLRRLEPEAVGDAALPPDLQAMVTGESPRAYVCVGRTCAAPVTEPDALGELLRSFRVQGGIA